MATSKPIVTDKFDSAQQTTAQSKNTAPPRQRINIQMVQNILLVGLDHKIDETSADYDKTMTRLHRVVNNINKYTDDKQCIEFLQSTENEKSCMVISDALGQQMVSQVHDMTQVDFIFIFCADTDFDEQWTEEWPKIKGVFTGVKQMCEALKKAVRHRDQDSMPISFIPIDTDGPQKGLDQLEPSFMYTQILKEILLSIEFEEHHFKEFIQYCHKYFADSEHNLKKVKTFELDYRKHEPIWWYTSSSFQYRMLNNALRLLDGNVIVNMAFFISDLHRHLEQLHQEQFGGNNYNESFTLYRGQGLSKIDFEQLSKTKGGLLSFNNFLSTSKEQDAALDYIQDTPTDAEKVQVLFVMTIDPTQSNTPFASITDVSFFGEDENEVLFSMHTVFRIDQITLMDENKRLFQVKLTLTTNNDKDLQRLTAHIRKETAPHADGWYRLVEVLQKIGYSDKAQEVCEALLKETTDDGKQAHIYNQLGSAQLHKGEHQEAIAWYKRALQIFEKILPTINPNVASCCNNIGNVYHSMGKFSAALSFYEKALAIQKRSPIQNHQALASSYNNIGYVSWSTGDYPKALSSHKEALAIQKKSLPPNHPHLARSYINVGNVYRSIGEGPKALSYYEKALPIQQQSLPRNHPDLAVSYNNIGLVYCNMGDHLKALSSLEKALVIQQQLLPPNHSDLAFPHSCIGLVYDNMGDYTKALSSYEKGLWIRQQSLPPNHSYLAVSYNSIGLVYDRMNVYPKAVLSLEKALAIQQKSRPPHHPDLADFYNNIGLVYGSMGDYPKALLSLGEALAIRKQSLPPVHPDLASSYSSIGLVYEKMNNFSKARSFYEYAVDITRQTSPPGHPALQIYRSNLEDVKKKL